MKWIETLMLRSSGEVPGILLAAWTRDVAEEPGGPEQVASYRNHPLKTDVMIRMHWETDAGPSGPSSQGRRLHHMMKDYGLVCHTVWIEEIPET